MARSGGRSGGRIHARSRFHIGGIAYVCMDASAHNLRRHVEYPTVADAVLETLILLDNVLKVPCRVDASLNICFAEGLSDSLVDISKVFHVAIGTGIFGVARSRGGKITRESF